MVLLADGYLGVARPDAPGRGGGYPNGLEAVTCPRNFGRLRGPAGAADPLHGVHVTAAADRAIAAATTPLIGVVMGSASDFDTLAPACEILAELGIPYEARVVSAHRTPDWLFEYAETAFPRGLRAIIAGAGGAAHLPGMLAAKTLVPVLGVPVVATPLNGMDALLSIVQMPAGVPVATFAIGKPGAANAALFAAQLLAADNASLRDKLAARRSAKATEALSRPLAAPNAIDFIPSAT